VIGGVKNAIDQSLSFWERVNTIELIFQINMGEGLIGMFVV